MVSRPRFDFGFDGEEFDMQVEDDVIDNGPLNFSLSQSNSSLYSMDEQTTVRTSPMTPTGRPAAYPLQKRGRPFNEFNRYSPYLPPQSQGGSCSSSAWYEHTDSQIQALIESQKKMMNMFEKVSERIGDMEKAVSTIQAASPQAASSSSSETSPEQKKRLPTQLSVC